MSTPATPSHDRIAQFEKMAAADPSNEMAHFSLGTAYLNAGRAAEAAVAFERCVAVNREMSKAWQLGGDAMIKAGWEDRAVKFLEEGYVIASSKGDRMPQTAMEQLLESIGRKAPKIESANQEAAEAIRVSGGFVCRQSGRPGTKMDSPPFRGNVGEWIQANISKETFSAWIGQGTKVINELRLDFSRDKDVETYDSHMREYLGIDDAVMQSLK